MPEITKPQIDWNGKSIQFGYDLAPPDISYPDPREETISVAGQGQTRIRRADCLVSIMLASFFDDDLLRRVRQWHQWAKRGLSWYLALDSNERVLTALASGASAGDDSIEVESATGIVEGKTYIIRNATNLQPIKVESVVGTTVNFVTGDTLDYNFAAGDRFRSEYYWPARLLNVDNPVQMQKDGPGIWDLLIQIREDMNPIVEVDS